MAIRIMQAGVVVGLLGVFATKPQKRRHKRLEGYRPTRWGDLIREIREDQGISQRQLAELAQVNRNALRRLEKCASGSSMDMVERVAKVLGYSFDLCCEQKPLP